jgi:hypothetical protein
LAVSQAVTSLMSPVVYVVGALEHHVLEEVGKARL